MHVTSSSGSSAPPRDSLKELFARLRDAPSQAVAGQRFERLMKFALERHPGEYGPERFNHVWLWNEWPARVDHGYGQDIGVDLVAEQTEAYGGGLCAIQCKFYDDATVPTAGVNSFLAASSTSWCSSRILVATGDLTGPARGKIRAAKPRCEVLHASHLADWPIVWDRFIEQPESLEYDHTRHTPRPYQAEAVQRVAEGLAERGARGQLILPCGTGKSVVALWSAERLAGRGRRVLYVVPSLALMGQTMREWARHRSMSHRYVGICSDPTTGRRSSSGAADDLAELAMPVTTDSARIKKVLHEADPQGAMTVVFCTYQSLRKIAEQHRSNDIPGFDLVICDEAHRTTGIERERSEKQHGAGRSGFRLVHNDSDVPARRRLYMTATPRIFTPRARQRVADESWDSYSMDDAAVYGSKLFEMSFGEAVDNGWLSDYEVVVIAVSGAEWRARYENDPMTTDKKTGLRFADYVKLAGCWDALADPHTRRTRDGRYTGEVNPQGQYARTAIAFTNRVKASKSVEQWWPKVAEPKHQYDAGRRYLEMEVFHIDGSTSAIRRQTYLDRLKNRPGHSTPPENSSDPASEADDESRDPSPLTPERCLAITNARVLTEGVDVPALDAILFLEPRTSKIDITQAVGRVMRRAPGKQKGYIVIPVVVPEGGTVSSTEVLNGSDFKIVWSVVKALRAHDERVNYWINQKDVARKKAPVRVLVTRPQTGQRKRKDEEEREDERPRADTQLSLALLPDAIASKLVDTCGDRQMWPRWGGVAADVCASVQERLKGAFGDPGSLAEMLRADLDAFVDGLAATLGGDVTRDQAIEMVAQHVVTIPVFDAFLTDSQFAALNPISRQIQRLLEALARTGVSFEHELRPLTRAYARMRDAFEGALSGAGKLDILRQVYEGFFKEAMPKTVKRLGIVYTPVELVDFMLRSVDAVCRKEFGKGLTDRGVHVLDPFAGTGTFLARLLTIRDADGNRLIRDADVARKYRSELHANELVLLAYYVAALKIEEAAAERGVFDDSGGNDASECVSEGYRPFSGIVFTDTFRRTGAQERQFGMTGIRDNLDRAAKQDEVPIEVIVGNPPWSAGQKSAGDDNPNIVYDIAGRIGDTYGRRHHEVTGRSGGGNAMGNLYVEAFRWGSDRLGRAKRDTETNGKHGVLAFVHPNSLATGTSLAGMRAGLRDEFSAIYVINLRGDAYKSGEEFRKEGDKLFGGGSRNGVQMTVLVRNLVKKRGRPAIVRMASVPEYSSLSEKLRWVGRLGTVLNKGLNVVPLGSRHDWVDVTDGSFEELLPVCEPGKVAERAAVQRHARGLGTSCDTYVYSFSRSALRAKVQRLIHAYESARNRTHQGVPLEVATGETSLVDIKWTATLKQSLRKDVRLEFDESRIREVLYRPFTKIWLYEDARILSSIKTVSKMFPTDATSSLTIPETQGGGGATGSGHYRHGAQQQVGLRSARDPHPPGPLRGRHQPAEPRPPAPSLPADISIMISGTSNMTFQALATTTLPDLAAIKGSQQTRAIPRRRSS